jgi:hypothetical protein
MALREYIERQVTFTGTDCIVPATLDQAFDTAQPYTDVGFIIVSHTAPNTTTYPELKRFLWAECTSLLVLTGNYYYYSSAGWTLLNLTDGSQLLPQTVLLSALSAQGGDPGDIIQVDGTGDGFIFTNLSSAFVNGTLDPAKLIPGANGQLLSVVGGVVAWITFDSSAVIATIANGTFPIAKLQPGTAKYVLRTNAAGDADEYVAPTTIFDDGTLPIVKLAPGSGNANKYMVQNAAGTAWEAQVPNFSRVQVQTSTALPVPTSGNTVTFAHGFSVVPTEFDAYFVCNTANSQYQVGDRIKTSAVMATGGAVELPAFLLYANATNLGLTQGGSGFPPDRATMNRDNGDVTGSNGDFVGSQWDLYFQAKLIT